MIKNEIWGDNQMKMKNETWTGWVLNKHKICNFCHYGSRNLSNENKWRLSCLLCGIMGVVVFMFNNHHCQGKSTCCDSQTMWCLCYVQSCSTTSFLTLWHFIWCLPGSFRWPNKTHTHMWRENVFFWVRTLFGAIGVHVSTKYKKI